MSMNRLYNITNPGQGNYKRVLCVCSAGLLRSPTAAVVLAQEPYNFNTRAAGLVADYALIPVDMALLAWADEIVCMTPDQEMELRKLAPDKKIICLGIKDSFMYRDPELIKRIRDSYGAHT